MIFEVGKCYEHTNGLKIKIVAEAKDTHPYGEYFIAEDIHGRLFPMGKDETATLNWMECDDFMAEQEEENAIEPIEIPTEIDVSEMNPDAVEVKPDDVEDEETEVMGDSENDE